MFVHVVVDLLTFVGSAVVVVVGAFMVALIVILKMGVITSAFTVSTVGALLTLFLSLKTTTAETVSDVAPAPDTEYEISPVAVVAVLTAYPHAELKLLPPKSYASDHVGLSVTIA